MAVVGAVGAVIGAIVMLSAKAKLEKALLGESFGKALSGGANTSTYLSDAATSQSHLGLGMLIFGLALLLFGLLAMALRRS